MLKNAGQLVNNEIKTAGELIARLEAAIRKSGKDLPINISVLQEENALNFGTFFEDRSLSKDLILVKQGDEEFLELYV